MCFFFLLVFVECSVLFATTDRGMICCDNNKAYQNNYISKSNVNFTTTQFAKSTSTIKKWLLSNIILFLSRMITEYIIFYSPFLPNLNQCIQKNNISYIFIR